MAAHAVLLALVWVAILATVSLALRLGLTPVWAAAAGLIFTGVPAVLGMAGTAMPDVPAMALGVAGLERLVARREERKAYQGVLAAILLGFAPHARLHLVLLFGVAALLVVGNVFARESWKGQWTRWLPLTAALLITGAVAALTGDAGPGARSVIGTLNFYSSTSAIASNTVAFAIHWVLAMAFALPWLALHWRAIVKRFWLLLIASGAAALLLFQAHRGDAPYALAPVAGPGVACLVDVLIDAFQRRDGLQLTLGIWLLVSIPAIIYVHLPSKYLIVSAPASALLLERAASECSRLVRYVLGLSAVAGVLLGIAILRADAHLPMSVA